jgi:hypothetical protein
VNTQSSKVLNVTVVEAINLAITDIGGSADPYVVLEIEGMFN